MPDPVTVPAATPAPAPVVPGTTETPKPIEGNPNGSTPAPESAAKPPAGGEVEGVKKEENPANPDKPYKVKVEGKEYNMSLDDLQRYASKGIGLEKKLQAASRKGDQADKFFQLLKENPMAILTNPNIGLDFKKLAQEFLLAEIEKEKLSPEQRELLETKELLKAAEMDKKTAQEKIEKSRMDALVQHHSEQIEKDITTTLETSGLPKTRSTVKRIAYYMEQGLTRGVPLQAKDVVDLVRADYQREILELFSTADGDTMSKMLGDPIIKKLMDAQLKKINGGQTPPPKPPIEPTTPGRAPDGTFTKKMERDEWRAHMDRMVA